MPDPQDRATFERSVLDWAELDKEPHAALLQWHRDLVALRRRLSALSDGNFEEVQPTWDEDARWFCLTRGPVTVAVNLGDRPQAVPVPDPGADVLLASDPSAAVDAAQGGVRLGPDSVAILGPP